MPSTLVSPCCLSILYSRHASSDTQQNAHSNLNFKLTTWHRIEQKRQSELGLSYLVTGKHLVKPLSFNFLFAFSSLD